MTPDKRDEGDQMEEDEVYYEVPPDVPMVDLNVAESMWGRLVAKAYNSLFQVIRQAGVTTLLPVGREGMPLFEEEGLLHTLGVEPGERLEACRLKATERRMVTREEELEERVYWPGSDVISSGLIWAGQSEIRHGIILGVMSGIVPSGDVDGPLAEVKRVEELEGRMAIMEAALPGIRAAIASEGEGHEGS